ncbi:hypothetical protein PTKIN_Ptkin01aG0280900 [Pterospermum kingtungense]
MAITKSSRAKMMIMVFVAFVFLISCGDAVIPRAQAALSTPNFARKLLWEPSYGHYGYDRPPSYGQYGYDRPPLTSYCTGYPCNRP